MSYKGWFRPKNPKKYKGDATNVVYRSNWELRVMKHFDEDPNVLWWASEELVIPYRSPIDQRMHRYFPDFIARVRQKTGKEKTIVIEIKPEKQTKKPIQKRQTRRFLEEAATYAINQEKWRAADIFCQKEGWDFMVLTEKDLGI
jgi:hypothetical protein|tara:strand:- start:657 stop:1088 length:432 start_codon:yes stop_codon:yes gene_type:complete